MVIECVFEVFSRDCV
ncbi:hypothetical protein KUCAC02_025401 [Chaenocephalus aceratus]|uniref:Uncharacterized protein n=1 Tax=Chaenocephalus aceratus TaxID=36190 RepID=A0ACB9VTY9_CHAAC|nr:hypothetical protein KUCAC02_025401 [Chaenocephalus aceratus]